MPGATPPATVAALNRPRSKSGNFHFADDPPTPTNRDTLVFPPTPGDAAQTFNALVDEKYPNGAMTATTTILKSKGKGKAKEVVCEQPPIAIGIQPDDVYDSQMSWWRAGVRRILVRNLQTESEWLAAMQVSAGCLCRGRAASRRVRRRNVYGARSWTRISCTRPTSAPTRSS